MKKKSTEEEFPVVIIDTREQCPLQFPSTVRTQVRTLKTGDYSLLGFENEIAIERKSKQDAYGSLGQGRARFEREIERMTNIDYRAIVVESSLRGFLEPPDYSSMNPRSALRSLLAWSVKYRIPVIWGEDRPHAAAVVLSLLQFWWKYRGVKNEGGSAGLGEQRS